MTAMGLNLEEMPRGEEMPRAHAAVMSRAILTRDARRDKTPYPHVALAFLEESPAPKPG